MLTIKNKDIESIGELENAFNIGNYERRANQLSSFSFSLPKNDPKNELCNHFNYVQYEGETGYYDGLYQIMPKKTVKNTNTESITYTCKHVLRTLLNEIMLGYHQFTNLPTREVIEGILDMQENKHWQLGTCEFERYFHYSFENEAGLLAPILSVAKPFDEPYLFTFDTSSYPWTINLVKSDNVRRWDIVWGRDMISFDKVSDPEDIVNRIYPLGYGEGVNQLGIEDINNGVPYVEDVESIKKWGMVKYPFIDKRFEDAETLKANAESLLKQWKDPSISFNIKSVDLSIKEEYKHLKRPFFSVGDIQVDDTTYQARIVGEKVRDLSDEYDVEYIIENKLDDIATIQEDVERKQQVNDAYSQGATNHDSVTLSENCDANYPLRFRIWIPEDVINVNTMILTYESTYFRGYTKGSEAGGYFKKASVIKSESTEGGGAYTKPSEVVTETSESGGDSVQTTSTSGAGHSHKFMEYVGFAGALPSHYKIYRVSSTGGQTFDVFLPSENQSNTSDLRTTGAADGHQHTVNTPPHTHGLSVTIPGINIDPHTHGFSVEIPGIEIPKHTHTQIYGIYEHNALPNQLTITVDGNLLPTTSTSAENVDLVPYLQKDSSGKITRNRWATIEISPDSLARINATVVTRLFIQSRLGGKY